MIAPMMAMRSPPRKPCSGWSAGSSWSALCREWSDFNIRIRYLAKSRLALRGEPRQRRLFRHQGRGEFVNRMAVPALLLGDIQRMVGGRDQPIRERPDFARPLRDPDRNRDRNVVANAAGGVIAADIDDAPGDKRPLVQAASRQHHAEFIATGTRQKVARP